MMLFQNSETLVVWIGQVFSSFCCVCFALAAGCYINILSGKWFELFTTTKQPLLTGHVVKLLAST